MAGSPTERLTRFDVADAVPLAETAMMSMPTLTDPSVGWETVGEWAGSSGHVVKVLLDGARTHADARADEAPAHQ